MSERATAAPPIREPNAIGVVDVGSNTARLVVFDTNPVGVVRPVFELKEIPRLGAGTGPDGSLSPEAFARGIESLGRFARALKSLGVPRTLTVTTSAVRDAPNGAEFVRTIARETGILLRVLTGAEEARYGYLGVASAWALGNDLVIDLGGGSLQVVETRLGALANSVSLPLGGLRLTQRFVRHDPPKEREIDDLREYVRDAVRSAIAAFGGSNYRVFGIGGTVRAVARAAIELREYPIPRVHGYPIRDHDLEALTELISEMPTAKRRAIPGIGVERADVMDAGLIVLSEILRSSKADEIAVSGTGIREGLALEAIRAELPVPNEVLAIRSTTAAAERFSFSRERGREVAELSVGLFDLFADAHHWGPSERLSLRVAAEMHDAGVSIDLWRHAHHSAYLIRNYPIWGLTHRETLLAASIVALHAGDDLPSGMRKGFAPILRPSDGTTARQLGTILQLAGLLAPADPRFSLAAGGKVLAVSFSRPAGTTLPPRTMEKARKPIERELDIEVRFRDG
ncbi:MAG: Ppx/GppA family phosphatase [Candidatus Thermoplasmatota archaeon]|jgi:exopolyphosphatase/guanosine-5'-triphosphate,3'-diphosphate pyrophosphatase|nr:Ppx/GppA family phosphatase [Candidatus Thermoplasmatota archaeon]MCL5983125.1 Ppx/GppA family phosphatase [Candidatus Thermoplasmatota archaeon]